MYSQLKRIEYLDSIRGLAAVFVLLFHSTNFQWPGEVSFCINLPVINILFDAGAAVAMFFVLSGFVLARPYLLPAQKGALPRKIFLPTFYLRRLTRIWIPWFFVFCLCGFVAKYLVREYETVPAYGWADRVRLWQLPLTWISALKQITLMNLGDANGPHLVSADWSLGVELRASLLIPLFVFLSKGRRFILLPIIGVLLFILAPRGYYVSFLLGVALARSCDHVVGLMHSFPQYAKWIILAIGILFYESRHIAIHLLHLPESTGGYFWCLNSVGCVIILIICMSCEGIQTVLNHRILVFLGRISYSVYLLQFIAIFCLQPLTVHTLNSMGITQTAVLLPASLCVSLFFTIALAALTYQFVEIPAIEFGHRMTRLIQKQFIKS